MMRLPDLHSPPAVQPAIELVGINQNFGKARVLDAIDLVVEPGRVVALLGPSGCGKTTLLKIIAGLLAPTAGTVRIFGATMASVTDGTFVPPERRGLGMVFQDYALWPHLTVGGNVAFPLEMRGVARAERTQKIKSTLARVALAGYEERDPASLSGGQQQRVAIARAIVAEPRLVLFDEPLSNLDRELREALVGEIGALVRGLGLSAVYVTHDQAEAFTLADIVAVMHQGRIVQSARPEQLVDNPAVPEVAGLLDLGPVATVERRDDGWWFAPAAVKLVGRGQSPFEGEPAARVLLARNALRLAPPSAATLSGSVLRSQFRGDRHLVTVRLGDAAAAFDVSVISDRRTLPGERVALALDAERLRWFPLDTDSHRNIAS